MSQTGVSRIWRAFGLKPPPGVLQGVPGPTVHREGAGHRGALPSTKELKESINHWIDQWNDNPRPFVWHKSADEILTTLNAYTQRISDSGR